jgi:hypothetical protein
MRVSRFLASQRRSSKLTTPLAVVQELVLSRRPSFVRRLFVWITAALCILFAASTIVFLVMRGIETSMGGALLMLLLCWVARDWLANPKRGGA